MATRRLTNPGQHRGPDIVADPAARGYLDFWQKSVKPANPYPPGSAAAKIWEDAYERGRKELER